MIKLTPETYGEWGVEEEIAPNAPAWSDNPEASDRVMHIVPHNDLFPHVLSACDCWCSPELDEDEPSVVIHNSADGRELYEQGIRKLN